MKKRSYVERYEVDKRKKLQLEVAKSHQVVNVTSESGEVDVPPVFANSTTPEPKSASKEHSGEGKSKGAFLCFLLTTLILQGKTVAPKRRQRLRRKRPPRSRR